MAVRVVNESSPVIRITGQSSPAVAAPINEVRTVHVNQNSSIINVPSISPPEVSIEPIASPSVVVSSPEVRPFKVVLIQGPKGDPGEAGTGTGELSSELFVTNEVGDIEEGFEIGEETSLEVIIRNMLTDSNVYVSGGVYLVLDGADIGSQQTNTFASEFKMDISSDLFLTSGSISVKNANYLDAQPLVVKVVPSNQFISAIYKTSWDTSLYDQSQVFSYFDLIDGVQLGENKIIAVVFWQDEVQFGYGPSQTVIEEIELVKFYVGKKIRAFTSVCADPQGSNISPNPLNQEPNLYQSESAFIENILFQDPNEDIYSEIIVDFTSEGREVIVPLSIDGNTYSVNDSNRFLVIELPSEFLLSEVAATTAGSGAYSLSNSIVSLGGTNPLGDNYLNAEGHAVRYYRFVVPGAFTEDLKLDLHITLSE
jgi:hypothetical protein